MSVYVYSVFCVVLCVGSAALRQVMNTFLFVPRLFMCLEMGSPLQREEELVFLNRRHVCYGVGRTNRLLSFDHVACGPDARQRPVNSNK
jgi:hypothetical protein